MKESVNGLWIGSKISNLERLGMASFLGQGHGFVLWSYSKLEALPEGVIQKDAREILPESELWYYQRGEGSGSYSAVSNTFRYKFLYEHGGWWVDTDVVCLKPFNFSSEYVFAAERNKNGSSSPTTCVIKCPAGSLTMKRCWETARKSDKITTKWGTIGPKLLATSIFEHKLSEFVRPVETFCPVHWFDSEIDPVVSCSPDLSNSYSVHLWHEMWRRKGLDKDGHYPESLFESLKNAILPTTTSR